MDYSIIAELIVAGSIFLTSISYLYLVCCRKDKKEIEEPIIA